VFWCSRCHVRFLGCLHLRLQCGHLSTKHIDDTLLTEDNVAQLAIGTFKERKLGFDLLECVVVHSADPVTGA
jgi:hypothetical protein